MSDSGREGAAAQAAGRPAAGLYVVGTPIGNLGDITLRALEILRGVDSVLCEDTRITRRLTERFEIRAELVSCHKFNEAARTEGVVARIRAGAAVALVTDSGMPGVSDPGSRIVTACRAAGLPVTVIPGPSAVTSALALCGFGGGGFSFGGFLPHKAGARARKLSQLLARGEPAVLFESPFRLMKLLDEIEAAAPERNIFVGRELTKHFEECLSGTAREIRTAFAGRSVKGELVVVLAPAARDEAGPDDDGEPDDAPAPE